ncbi:MAG: immunoglobulin-like domain-containing protein [Hyalangium sp.]|uniref:immunoglobulin-like domain-containing protein n=1 Tax=Hyalangium sp. TaxID=2028555 RepID=UPI00389A84AB
MTKRSVLGAVAVTLAALGGLPAAAHTRTPWQMHEGLEVTSSNPLGLLPFACTPSVNGDACEFSVATIPPKGDAGWKAAPDGSSIGLVSSSLVCQAPVSCLVYGDFIYYQTQVNVGAGPVNQFTVSFNVVDDGLRVTIFNSKYPNGITAPEGFLHINGSLSTGNLAAYVATGEVNRVVLTQVDDCCTESRLTGAVIQINGEVVGLACQSDSECNDGDSCTADFCSSGTCSHPLLACSNGQSCAGPILNLTSAATSPTWACTPNSNGEPSLTVHGSLDMTLECGQDVWVDPGAEAWDSACHPLTVHTYNTGHDSAGPGPNTCAEGTYSVQYIAWDSAGKTVGAIRSVKVDDTQPPTLMLKGAEHMTLQCGHGYVEPGWEAWDACYGNITPEVKVYGYPNGWVAGTYTVTYTLTDSGGNSAPTLTRTVDVVNCPW